MRIAGGEGMLLAGSSNINDGNIINLGGSFDTLSAIENHAGGEISGRGLFNFGDGSQQTGLANEGALLLSGGVTDLFGYIKNLGEGSIEVAPGTLAVFHDAVDHSGGEFRTDAGGTTLFRGKVLADGPFLGAGLVQFSDEVHTTAGDARTVRFDGDVVFTATSTLFVQLTGQGQQDGEFLDVAGELILDGKLSVGFAEGFETQVTGDDRFTIALAKKGAATHFLDLVNDRVIVQGGYGSFAVGMDDENVVVLEDFQAIPEPAVIVSLPLLFALTQRRRRRL